MTRARASVGTENISVKGEGVTLSVDPRSNSLIFYTTGTRYQTLLPMIQRLDVPPKQILLEAMIAEVTLTGEFAYGVEFAFSSGEFSGGTLGNLGLPDGGLALNWIGNVTDQVRLKLSRTNTLVNVLSNPTLVVRDGVEATIKVGNDVPTVGATASRSAAVRPADHAGAVSQDGPRPAHPADHQRRGRGGDGDRPEHLQHRARGLGGGGCAGVLRACGHAPKWCARSGESILLAGLISERQNDNSSGVPGLSKIPGLGYLFRSDSKSKERTELVVLITPRVIEDPRQWNDIRIGMQGALENLVLPEPTAAGVGRGAISNACRSVRPTAGSAAARRSPCGRRSEVLESRILAQVSAVSRFLLLTSDISSLNFRARTGLERAGLLLVVYNQQESKVPHGGPDVR